MAESAGRRDAASEPVVNLAVTLAESGGKPDDYADLLDELRSPPTVPRMASDSLSSRTNNG